MVLILDLPVQLRALLLHLDRPHLTVQGQRGHAESRVLVLAVQVIQIFQW